MSIEQALLSAILEHPRDDDARRIYADWCEDHGQPERGEWVRVQLDLARLPAWAPAWDGLKARARALLEAHQEEWLGPLPAWARPGARFRRGFVAVVAGRVEQFVADAEHLFRTAPVEGLRGTGGS